MESTSSRTKALQEAAVLIKSASSQASQNKFTDAYTDAHKASLVLLNQLDTEIPVTRGKNGGIDDYHWQRYIVRSKNTLDCVVVRNKVKQALLDAIVLPMLYERSYTTGARPKKAILMSGPNGTGKTALVGAVANHISTHVRPITLLSVQASAIMSKWSGQAEANVDSLFEFAAKNTPIILYLDEVDSFFGRKKDNESDGSTRCKNTFLQRMSGLSDLPLGITVLASTNKPQLLDTSFHSRFDLEFCIPLPSQIQRSRILEIRMRNMPHVFTKTDFKKIAKLTQGFSGRDLEQLLTQAQDQQLKKLQGHNYYIPHYCFDNGLVQSHVVSCRRYGTARPCSLEPVMPTSILAKYIHWIEAREDVEVPPITRKDMKKALLTTRKTTTELDMVDLEKYYAERMIPCQVEDEEKEDQEQYYMIIWRGITQLFKRR